MKRAWLCFALTCVLLTFAGGALADARDNCVNRCTLGQIQCTRPIVAKGGTNVTACNQQFESCMATCPPHDPKPAPGSGDAGGGSSASGNGTRTVVIPSFTGNAAPLPPPVDTSSVGQQAVDAEQERLRLQANFEALRTYVELERRRDELIAFNRALEALGRAAGSNAHLSDPAPIAPPQLVPSGPPSPRPVAALSNSWPPQFQVIPGPLPSAAPPPPQLRQQDLPFSCGLVDLHVNVSQLIAVPPVSGDDQIKVTIVAKAHLSVSYDIRVTALDGSVYESSNGGAANVRAGTVPPDGRNTMVPFPATNPARHSAKIEILNWRVVDIDAAYAKFLAQNPTCDPAINPAATCYFTPWRYSTPCPTTGPVPVR